MSGYHLMCGKYLSYVSPRANRKGKTTMFALWPFDRGTRTTLKNFLGAAARNPLRRFRRAHIQSIMFIQPIDFTADGQQSMCDGCPDITVYNDELVWSCRMEECKTFGTFIRSVPRSREMEAENG
jgi:hypothetical protein